MHASIVIPAYNCEKTIQNALQSVAKSIDYCQGQLPDFMAEIILVVDGATDGTGTIAQVFARDRGRCVIVVNPQNLGAGPARNIGVRHASGDLIFFLDGDDIFFPEHIYTCVVRMQADPALHWVQTKIRIAEPIHPGWLPLIENTVPFNICVRRWVHDFIGGYPDAEVFKTCRCEDALYRRMLRSYFRGDRIDRETMQHFRYPGNALDRQMEKLQASPAAGISVMTDEEKQAMPQVRRYHQKQTQKIARQLAGWMSFLQETNAI